MLYDELKQIAVSPRTPGWTASASLPAGLA